MEKLNIDGTNIAYLRHGKGSPLVLIHGYPLDHTIWDGVVSLLEKEFDLIIPDMRGFGKSDVKAADDKLTSYATDIAKLLDQLKIGKAGLAGHSMGGYVALAFAREFPERVSGLAMISSQTPSDTSETREGRLSTAKQVEEKGVGIVVEAMTPKLSTDERVQDFVKRLIAHQRPEGISNALRAMAGRSDSTELFTTFKFPVVIVHGDADLLIPIKRAREMMAILPTAHYFELADLGHMTMMERPDAVAKALTSLIE